MIRTSKQLFICRHCDNKCDADLNASLNHERNLISANVLLSHRRRKPFFWYEDRFCEIDGSEIRVPDTKKRKKR